MAVEERDCYLLRESSFRIGVKCYECLISP
jgi:hypothetical protein